MLARFFAACAALTLALSATPAAAYWEFGHETVASIAWANVTPATRTAIRRLLAQQALLETPECPAGTIEQASVWADCIKPLKNADGSSRFGYAYSWHYENVDVCQPFDLTGPCKDGNCVSAQISRAVTMLKGRATPRLERVQALLFLAHFVGDLHQPLHAGDRGDKGGNDVKAAYGIYSTPRLNLHSIWDGLLAERAITSAEPLVRRYSAADRAEISKGSVEDWAREGWQVARDVTYASALNGDPCGPVPPLVTLDNETIARIAPVARLEVQRGGLRLAKLLDDALR